MTTRFNNMIYLNGSIEANRILILTATIVLMGMSMASADTVLFGGGSNYETIVQKGTGINDNFDQGLLTIVQGVISMVKPIAIILTALAGMMIMFGWDSISKTAWTTIFGIGIALNIGYVIFDPNIFGIDVGSTGPPVDGGVVTDLASSVQIGNTASANADFLSRFMMRYIKLIEHAGQTILPYLERLTGLLLLVEAMSEAAQNVNEGNKLKFLIGILLKGGFYLWVLENWLSADTFGVSLTGALSNGFEQLGFMMGQDQNTELKPDSIIANAGTMFTALYEALSKSFSLMSLNTWCLLIATPVILYCVIMTSLEIFMVRIEYYTMALLTMPLLSFGVCRYTKFLSEKTFGVMFNIATKCMAMAFIQSFSLPYLTSLAKDFTGKVGELNSLPSLLMEYIIACLVILYLTKSVKEIINTLLTGSPNLAGGGMTAMATGAAMTGAKVAGGGAAAGAQVGKAALEGGVQGAQAAGGSMSSMSGMARGAAGAITGGGSAAANMAMSSLGGYAKKALAESKIANSYREGKRFMDNANGSGGDSSGSSGGSGGSGASNIGSGGGSTGGGSGNRQSDMNIGRRVGQNVGKAIDASSQAYKAMKEDPGKAVNDAASKAGNTVIDAATSAAQPISNTYKAMEQNPGKAVNDAVSNTLWRGVYGATRAASTAANTFRDGVHNLEAKYGAPELMSEGAKKKMAPMSENKTSNSQNKDRM